ncbi:MAG: flagellar filament capping protein FliD [Verrucomicrobia bacterium]|nr:flagellar filament capping protein FliD [Verrucomicrobiota bacterium]
MKRGSHERTSQQDIMALSADAISLIQAISISQNQSVAAFVATALVTQTSTTFGASELTQARQTRSESSQSTISTKLDDLDTLDDLLQALISAASSLRPSPTSLGSEMDVDDTDANVLELDDTDSASLQTGDKIMFTSGSFSSGLQLNTPYYVSRGATGGGNTDFTLFNTRSDALNNTNAITFADNIDSSVKAKQIIPEPETGIEEFFTAYNDVQDFLAEKLVRGGSLADETQLKSLPAQLSQAVVGLLKDANFGPALTSNSSDRTLTVDETSLQSQLSANPQAIASLFEDTTSSGSGFAKSVQDIAEVFAGPTGVVGEIETALTSELDRIDSTLSELIAKAVKEQETTLQDLAKISSSTAAVSLQISFINKVGTL